MSCSHRPQLLIVDDDQELVQFLTTELEIDGYTCQQAANGQQALQQVRQNKYDLILLDWSLPDFSGIEVCRRIRKAGIPTPVVMLTARDEVIERVKALDFGADDYLTKPFSLEELLARIRARLRRKSLDQPGQGWLRLADLALNPDSRVVSRAGQTVELTAKEFDLLTLLMRQPNRVHERRSILNQLWGEDWSGDDNLLDVYIRYLRKKIERPGLPTLIQTVRGVGFVLREGAVR